MRPDLQKDIDALVSKLQTKHTLQESSKIMLQYLCASSLIQKKIQVLGAEVVDKKQKIDMRQAMRMLGNEVANLANGVVSLFPDFKDNPVACASVQKDLDAGMEHIIMFHFYGVDSEERKSLQIATN